MLEAYFSLNEKYYDDHDGRDAVFGYTEMSNVAMLATACWQQGRPAIVEYQEHKYKGKLDRKDKRKHYKLGRVDLYFGRGSSEFVCEAKQHFTRKASLDEKRLLERLFKAYKDVLQTSRDGKTFLPGYALVFVPHLMAKEVAKDAAKLAGFQEKLHESAASLLWGEPNRPRRRTHPNQRKEADYIDGYGTYFLDKPIKKWAGSMRLAGVTVLLRRCRAENLEKYNEPPEGDCN